MGNFGVDGVNKGAPVSSENNAAMEMKVQMLEQAINTEDFSEPFVVCLFGIMSAYRDLLTVLGIENLFAFYQFSRNMLLILDCAMSYVAENQVGTIIYTGQPRTYLDGSQLRTVGEHRIVLHPDEMYSLSINSTRQKPASAKRVSTIEIDVSNIPAELRNQDYSMYANQLFHGYLSRLKVGSDQEIPSQLLSLFVEYWKSIDTSYTAYPIDFNTIRSIVIHPENTDIVDKGKLYINESEKDKPVVLVKKNSVILTVYTVS
ncbi:MAG TPA: hypothetical protein PLX79_03325 [Candidatus Dojkabacteria bacterium]|nr:hypothetical protein [Candidatus Dojkabacteria bacterium]